MSTTIEITLPTRQKDVYCVADYKPIPAKNTAAARRFPILLPESCFQTDYDKLTFSTFPYMLDGYLYRCSEYLKDGVIIEHVPSLPLCLDNNCLKDFFLPSHQRLYMTDFKSCTSKDEFGETWVNNVRAHDEGISFSGNIDHILTRPHFTFSKQRKPSKKKAKGGELEPVKISQVSFHVIRLPILTLQQFCIKTAFICDPLDPLHLLLRPIFAVPAKKFFDEVINFLAACPWEHCGHWIYDVDEQTVQRKEDDDATASLDLSGLSKDDVEEAENEVKDRNVT